MIRSPGFWSSDGLMPAILRPLSAIWQSATAARLARGPRHRLGIPVICIGNLGLGGTGKTPLAITVAGLLQAMGIVPHFVSRGYGGSLPGPLKVDPAEHLADQVGDEPLLLAAFAPTWIGRDRADAARAAQADGAQAIILDDGLQNPALHHDLTFLAVDAAAGFGNGLVFPAGPLREPLKSGLDRVDLVVAIGTEAQQRHLLDTWPQLKARPVLPATIEPLATGMDWHGQRVLAFAGIGRPAKFFATLRSLGADILATREFGDHAPYSPRILARLDSDARTLGAQLVTTEKDAARLPPDFLPKVITLPVRLVLADETAATAALRRLFPRET